MVTECSSFDEAMSSTTGEVNLLAGNGMSIAFDQTVFRYSKLFDAADFGDQNPFFKKIFDALDTRDFESVAGALSRAKKIAILYEKNDLVDEISAHIRALRDALIVAVGRNHPEDRNCMDDEQARKMQTFLDRFISKDGKIFSLSYDALIYWAALRNLDPPVLKGKFADGFGSKTDGYLSFLGDDAIRPINLLFPHGTLYFFGTENDVFKPSAQTSKLLDIIRENLNEEILPIFVSEGESSQKRETIRKNAYLNYCFEKIDETKDNFFIFGHSLDLATDGHILEKIGRNKNIKNIFASFFEDKDATIANLLTIRTASKRNENDLALHVYPANTVACW